MPRSLRPQLANAWHLVWNKGLPQTPIFRESADYRFFLKLLSEIADLFQIKIYAYTLLQNSCHVALHTEHANLSQTMRFLFGKYAQYVNRTYERQGPLFRGRFHSLLFDPKNTLLDLLDMVKSVHLKPVQENITGHLDDYEWCSHRWYSNPYNAPAWLDVNTVLAQFSKAQSLAVKRYHKFIFENKAAAIKARPCRPHGQNGRSVEALTTTKLLDLITRAYNTTHWAIQKTGSGRKNMPRLVTMYCLRHLMGLSLKEITNITQAKDTNMVAQTLFRARRAIKNDEVARGLVGEIRKMR